MWCVLVALDIHYLLLYWDMDIGTRARRRRRADKQTTNLEANQERYLRVRQATGRHPLRQILVLRVPAVAK